MSLPVPNNPAQVTAQTPSSSPLPEANKPTSPKTSLPPGSSRLPSARPGSNRQKWLLGGTAVVAGLGLILLVVWWRGSWFRPEPYRGPVWTVKKEKLLVTIVERGALEAVKNSDLICLVKAGTKNSTVSTTIRWVIDQGVYVEPGQEVIKLDDSGLQEQLKDQEVKVHNAKADLITAEGNYQIQENQNASDVEAARIAYVLAQINLEKYEKGDYEQALKDVEGRMQTSNSDLALQEDRASWSERMYKKGLVSKSQVEGDVARREALRIALDRVNEEKRVLEKYTKILTLTDLRQKKDESERAYERAKLTAKTKIDQAEATRVAKKAVFEVEDKRRLDVLGEIAKCVVTAPNKGLVVYYVPEQAKFGAGNQQSIIAQGEPVREGQKMMQIPDLSHMQVNARVHEAMISRVRGEDPDDPSSALPAKVRVEAVPGRVMHGHVKMVATIPSQSDLLTSDVKLYQTTVTIDEVVEGLKPGMSAEVTIFADESKEPVLTVPVQAVVGNIAMGATRKCFVIRADGQSEEREIVVGLSNEKVVEVKSGLEDGETVALNPRALLGENSDMKPATPRTRGGADGDGGGGGGFKKDRKGKKGGPGGASPGDSGSPMPPMGGAGMSRSPNAASSERPQGLPKSRGPEVGN